MTAPHTLIIAEAGVNHSGSLETALALVDTAADAGADIVKFQTFNANSLAGHSAKKADYQRRTTGASRVAYPQHCRIGSGTPSCQYAPTHISP